MVLLGNEAQVEARFDPLEIVLILMQDRYTVCGERSIGLEIILDAPDGTPSEMAHLECRFGLFRDGVSVRAR
jgi:hypothetical protein